MTFANISATTTYIYPNSITDIANIYPNSVTE